jgi:hypothetical protein
VNRPPTGRGRNLRRLPIPAFARKVYGRFLRRRGESHGRHEPRARAGDAAAFDLDVGKLELRDQAGGELDPAGLKFGISDRVPATAAQDRQQQHLLIVERQEILIGRAARSASFQLAGRGRTS